MAAHTNVCVIGLGSMGMGAARACLQAGLNTWGVDINPDNCRALLEAGAKGAGPSAVPFAAELVRSCYWWSMPPRYGGSCSAKPASPPT